MVQLPQPRRQSRNGPQSGARLQPTAPSADLAWSPADELAALETVWNSLCQDAASSGPSLQLPNLPRSSPARVRDQRPERQRTRRSEAPGRMAS